MPNKIISDIIQDDQLSPKEQDRFSLVFQAHYQQWDADTVTCSVKSSRIVDEVKTPTKQIITISESIPYTLESKAYYSNDFDLVLINITGKDLNSRKIAEQAKSSYIEIYSEDNKLLDVVKPGRMRLTTMSSSCSKLKIKAVGLTAKITVFAFPE